MFINYSSAQMSNYYMAVVRTHCLIGRLKSLLKLEMTLRSNKVELISLI